MEIQDRNGSSVHKVIDGMTLVNRSYVYDFASESYCREHGRDKKDIVGHPVAQVFGETSFNRLIRKHLDACFTGNVVHYENWAEFPGDDPRYYRVSYSPYFDVSGQVTHAVVTSLDITDLKKEQDALEKSGSAFKSIVKNIHYGIFTFDTDGYFTFINDVVVKRSGYSRAWYKGKNLFDVVRPEEREKVQAHFQAIVRGEQVPPYEFSYQRAAFDIAWAQINTTSIQEQGQITGVLGVIIDVTKRVQAEQAVKESEKKYRTLFEDSRDAIFITNKDGKLTDVNPAFLKLFGYAREEAKELRAIDTYMNRDDCLAYMKEIEEHGFIDNFRVKLKKKDGTVMKCLLNGTPLRDCNGVINGYQGIVR